MDRTSALRLRARLIGSMHRPAGCGVRRAARGLLGLALALSLALACAPRHAAAAVGGCRSDPILVVNGTVTDVVSTLWTDPAVVRELDYTVTVPDGFLLGATTLTLGLGFPERVTYLFSAAQPQGTMRIDATVQTQPGSAPFPLSVRATRLLATQQADGTSAAPVTVILGA